MVPQGALEELDGVDFWQKVVLWRVLANSEKKCVTQVAQAARLLLQMILSLLLVLHPPAALLVLHLLPMLLLHGREGRV
jgi:hypothetical protein